MLEILYRPTDQIGFFLTKAEFYWGMAAMTIFFFGGIWIAWKYRKLKIKCQRIKDNKYLKINY